MVLLGTGPDDLRHAQNLRASGKASLATGHISPPWFIQVAAPYHATPRHAALLCDDRATLPDPRCMLARPGAAELVLRTPHGLEQDGVLLCRT